MDDIFDENGPDERGLQDWQRVAKTRLKDGFRDGVINGQDAKLQDGFNKGFLDSLNFVLPVGFMSGVLSGLLALRQSHGVPPITDAETNEARRILRELNDLKTEGTSSSLFETKRRARPIAENRSDENEIQMERTGSNLPSSETMNLDPDPMEQLRLNLSDAEAGVTHSQGPVGDHAASTVAGSDTGDGAAIWDRFRRAQDDYCTLLRKLNLTQLKSGASLSFQNRDSSTS